MKTIFVSYAHADFFWLDYILWPFRQMKESGKIHFYVDREQLDAGSRFEEELSNYIARADAFLILVGRDYLQSRFVREIEWPRILERLPSAKLFWIPLRPDYRSPGPDDPSEICSILLNHQTAYGSPLDFFENRSDLAKREALLQFESQVARWLRANPELISAPAARPVNTALVAKLKAKYLKFLQGYYGDIRIGSLGTKQKRVPLLPLTEVYVTLSVDTTTLEDRRQTRYLYDELAKEESAERPGQEKGDVIAKILQQRGHRLPEPSREAHTQGGQTFENVFARERVLVILGDPGSGKSVLCRWITFQMSMHQSPEAPSENAWLGVPRLPILIRTARFAEYVQDLKVLTGQELLDFLGQHTSEIPNHYKEGLPDQEIGGLCKQEIANGRAVLILDGLDEVGNPAIRRQVSQAIELFISRFIASGQALDTPARTEGQGLSGNQIVITSRVTGYHLAPLPLECAAHFRIRLLDDPAVKQLSCRMGQVLDPEETDSGIGDRFYERVESRSATNPAIASLKRNPLLLTSMFVYFVRNNSKLPTSRAELYERLVLDLSANWRLRGSEREEPLVLTEQENAAWQKLHKVLFENEDRGVLKLLCEIARFIHDKGTGGRIARPELRSLMGRLLSPLFTIKKTESGQSFAGTCADLLLRITSQDVGVLVEVGQDLFSFIHLTFQEYLVGIKLLQWPDKTESPHIPAARFIEKMDDPRWREPLLLAFSALASQTEDSQCQELLKGIRLRHAGSLPASEQSLPPIDEETATFLADLLREVPPERATTAMFAEELREVVLGLLDAYRACGLRSSSDLQRWRLAERIATIRRSTPTPKVDDLLKNLFLESSDPAPIAHLLWTRYWLPAETLEALLARQTEDSSAWDWPIQTALRQSLKENGHLALIPANLQNPAEGNHQAKVLYDLGSEVWMQRIAADSERNLQALPDKAIPAKDWLAKNPNAWNSLHQDPRTLRVLVAALRCVDDLEAIRWCREYRSLAGFLSRGSSYRDAFILSNAERLVWRWGADDIIYAMAVYLDSDPEQRFQRATRVPAIGVAFISSAQTALVDWLARLAKSPRLVDSEPGPKCQTPPFGVAKLALGQPVEPVLSPADLGLFRCTLKAISDAAFRGALRFTEWLGLDEAAATAPVLDDSEATLLFRHCVGIIVSAAQLPGPTPAKSRDGTRLALAVEANRWAAGFAGFLDDAAYHFAVLLESMKPDETGMFGPMPLLSEILDNPVLKLKAGFDIPGPRLWGISPDERVVPPEVFEMIAALSKVADEIRSGFGVLLAQAFISPLPASGFRGIYRRWAGSLFQDPASLAEDAARGHSNQQIVIALADGGDRLERIALSHDPIDAATEFEFLNRHGLIAEKQQSLVELLADRIGDLSWTDRCCFLARMASYRPSKNRLRWLQLAIDGADRISDTLVCAEFLARVRQTLKDNEAPLCSGAIERLARKSALLGAYAEGRLASYLCRESFAWNRDPRTACDPSWVVASIYGSIDETVRLSEGASRWRMLWKELEDRPSVSAISSLLDMAGDRSIPFTEDAARALTKLSSVEHNQPSLERLALQRVVTLLAQPSQKSLACLRRWAGARKQRTALSQALSIQANLLMAEQNRSLSGISLSRILAGYNADDLVRVRCANVLTGPRNDSTREERRYSLSTSDPEVLPRLIRVKRRLPIDFGGVSVARAVGLAFTDWIFDDLPTVRGWCERAPSESLYEQVLLTAMEWTEIWSAECQMEVARWALTNDVKTADRRHTALVTLVGRLVHIEKHLITQGLFDSLATIPSGATIRSRRCFPDEEKKSMYRLVAEACRRPADCGTDAPTHGETVASLAERALESHFLTLFPNGGQGGPATAPLASLGSLHYHRFFEKPEDCIELIEGDLPNPNFVNTVMSWSLSLLDRLSPSGDATENDRTLEALLSFATCLSERRPDFFARHAQPEDWIPQLGRVLLASARKRSKMAAVTLISRLKKVDLATKVIASSVGHSDLTLLDCLMHALRGSTEVQDRVIQLLPTLPDPQGIWPPLKKLLLDQNASGAVVAAAAQLLRSMLDTGAINLRDREEASGILRRLPSLTIHQRPLYRLAGSGNTEDPISAIYCGDLSEELARVVIKRR